MAKKKAKKGAKAAPKVSGRKKLAVKKTASKKPAKKKTPGRKTGAAGKSPTPTVQAAGGPVTLEEARRMVRPSVAATKASPGGRRRQAVGAAGATLQTPLASDSGPTPEQVGQEREKLEKKRRQERQQRIAEYTATMALMKSRGVKGLAGNATGAKAPKRRAPGRRGPAATAGAPLQIFAEGDSWFDYPVPFFGGGVLGRLEKRLGVPILNLAKAGDEVRFMLGVEERAILAQQLSHGCPAGGPWDVLLFSGGGNDIVGDPMALWVHDFKPHVSANSLIQQPRFTAALDLVRAGYEDLIGLRDTLSPSTHLVFHAYDFANPDGRGICHLGPWLQPTFTLRRFPTNGDASFKVVKAMLTGFAQMLQSLAIAHAKVTFINTQGTLAENASSWHNELHPSKAGFEKISTVFHAKLKALFPARVL
jgi:hypothetical protein